jgi:hypothetical protein
MKKLVPHSNFYQSCDLANQYLFYCVSVVALCGQPWVSHASHLWQALCLGGDQFSSSTEFSSSREWRTPSCQSKDKKAISLNLPLNGKCLAVVASLARSKKGQPMSFLFSSRLLFIHLALNFFPALRSSLA